MSLVHKEVHEFILRQAEIPEIKEYKERCLRPDHLDKLFCSDPGFCIFFGFTLFVFSPDNLAAEFYGLGCEIVAEELLHIIYFRNRKWMMA